MGFAPNWYHIFRDTNMSFKLISEGIKHELMELKVIFKEILEVLGHQNSNGEFRD